MWKRIRMLWTSNSIKVLFLVALVCFAALWFAEAHLPQDSATTAAVKTTATVVLVFALVQVITRYVVWKEAEEKIFRALEIRDAVRASGFRGMNWFSEIPWKELFRDSREIEMFFTSNTSWTHNHIDKIRDFLSIRDHAFTVVLRTPEIESLQGLAKRFAEKAERRARRILSTARLLQRTYDSLDPIKRGTLHLLHHPSDAIYTYYRFDSTALFVPYIMRPSLIAPASIPAFFFATDGEVYEQYLKKDFAHLRDEARPFTAAQLGEPSEVPD